MKFQTKMPLNTKATLLSFSIQFLRNLFYHLFSLSTSQLAQEKLPQGERFYFLHFSALQDHRRKRKRGKDPIMCLQDDSLKLMCLPCSIRKKHGFCLWKGREKLGADRSEPLSAVCTYETHTVSFNSLISLLVLKLKLRADYKYSIAF